MITSRRAKAKAPRSAEYCSTPRGDMWATAYARTRGIMAEYGYNVAPVALSELEAFGGSWTVSVASGLASVSPFD